MKYIAFLQIIFFMSYNSYSQDNTKRPTFEIQTGINHLVSNNSKFDLKFGFGLSIKRIWFSEKPINLITGFLFEKTKYTADYFQCGHFCHYKDMKFCIYSFSIPLMLRVNAGIGDKFFIEMGPSFEIIPINWGKGIEVLYPPLSSATETEISGNFEHDLIDFGANFEIGIKFPVKNYRMVLSALYHSSIRSIMIKPENDLTTYISVKFGICLNKK